MIRKLVTLIIIIIALGLGLAGYAYFFWYLELPRVQEARGLIKTDFSLDLDPVNVPVIRNGVVERYIVFQIVMTFEKEQERDSADFRMNSLRDRFFQSLYQYAETISNDRSINRTTLQLRLIKEAKEVLGEHAVKRVIISNAFERK